MHPRCIEPAHRPVDADVAAVPSKSWTHRALVLAALADGTSRIEHPLDADDTRATLAALGSLGLEVDAGESVWSVRGGAGRIAGGGLVSCAASGTTARFITALAALGERASRIEGSARLHERPMEELTAALSHLGASVTTAGGRLPAVVGGGGMRGGAVAISGRRSSQFASALLLVGAALPEGLELTVEAPRASFSYALLTARVLARFGLHVDRPEEGSFRVPAQRVAPAEVVVEGDHSSASYLFLAAAITAGRVRVRGLDASSLQPDARFARDLAGVGCEVTLGDGSITVEGASPLAPFDWDLAGAPDLAPTAAVLALFAGGTSRLRGISNLRDKESDRAAALADNLCRLGAAVRWERGAMTVRPPRDGPRGGPVDVRGDHRIAMAFAVAGLAVPGIEVSDPSVVAKSYPGFWGDLERLAGR